MSKKVIRLTESEFKKIIENQLQLNEMRIVKQTGKSNQFNIENMTLAMFLSILNALEYIRSKGLISSAGSQLLDALNPQQHKLKLGKEKTNNI